MALIIMGKRKLRFCTKAGNSPYNKCGVQKAVEAARIVDEYDYREAKLVILRPVIDKLIFEYNFADCGSYKRQIQELVLGNAQKLAEEKGIPFRVATQHNVGVKRLYHLKRRYKHNYVLRYKPTGAKIIIQLEGKTKGVAFMRCDLNPARLGKEGMEFFRDAIKLILANGYKEITFNSISKKTRAIKRLDIAVDMIGVDASDLEGRYIYKNKQLKKKPVQNSTGRTETMYFDMPENDKNEAYWYNKLQWFKDNAEDPVRGGQQSPYGKSLYTRFEYRIQETDKPIANLKSMLNHLKKVHFRAIDYSKVADKDYTHALFLRYALSRTREKALEMIPDERKADYAASYDKAIVDIWKPEKIWEEGWIEELVSLGICSPDKSKKKPKKSKKTSKKKLHPGAKTSG